MKEALKLALEALERNDYLGYQANQKAIAAIKEALAQPEQEPVFLIYDDAGGWIESNESEYRKTEEVNRWLLYTTPPKRPWGEPDANEIVRSKKI